MMMVLRWISFISYPATHAGLLPPQKLGGPQELATKGDCRHRGRDVQNGASHARGAQMHVLKFVLSFLLLFCPRYLSSGVFEMRRSSSCSSALSDALLLIGIVGGRCAFSAELRQRFVLQMLNGVDAVFAMQTSMFDAWFSPKLALWNK